jgi:SAM-dependent methyltransferase
MTTLAPHLGGHQGKTHIDEGALQWLINNGAKSFLDIGCGPGGMVELACSKGLQAIGVDGDHTINRFNSNFFIIHDYTTGSPEIKERYDIAWSVEFLEHVEEQYMSNYMKTFQTANNVIVTYAPPGWNGHHHVNLQEEDYWISKFEQNGFKLDRQKTDLLRRVSTLNLGKKGKKAFVRNRGLFFNNVN